MQNEWQPKAEQGILTQYPKKQRAETGVCFTGGRQTFMLED